MKAPPLVLKDCTVLGASGFPFPPGNKVALAFEGDTVTCNGAQQIQFSLVELADLSVTGPGTVVSGGGFIGGGFGVEGALEGMAIAGVLNALTTKKSTQTFMTLTTNFGELHLHYGQMEPAALRIVLCNVFARLRNMDKCWRDSRQQIIDDQLADGFISAEDAEVFRLRLKTPPRWQGLEAQQDVIDQSGPMGICPSCDKTIPLNSEQCRHCQANFGKYASWSVVPLGS